METALEVAARAVRVAEYDKMSLAEAVQRLQEMRGDHQLSTMSVKMDLLVELILCLAECEMDRRTVRLLPRNLVAKA